MQVLSKDHPKFAPVPKQPQNQRLPGSRKSRNKERQDKAVESHKLSISHSHMEEEESIAINTHQNNVHEHSTGTIPVQTHTHEQSNSTHLHSDASSDTVAPLRTMSQIQTLLKNANTDFIPIWVKSTAILTFSTLPEALTHGPLAKDDNHFQESGAMNTIVETVATLLALHCLGVSSVSCNELLLGLGAVWNTDCPIPVVSPVLLRLFEGMKTCPGPQDAQGQLVTPTAAALLKVLTAQSASSKEPHFQMPHHGVGAGTYDYYNTANVVQVLIYQANCETHFQIRPDPSTWNLC